MLRRILPWIIALVIGGLLVHEYFKYGRKIEFGQGEVYYVKPVTKAEARKLGEYLARQGEFSGTVQLKKENGAYHYFIVVKKDVLQTKLLSRPILQMFSILGADISALFAGTPVYVHLCDSNLKTKKVIELCMLMKFKHGKLYYTAAIGKSVAQHFGQYLVDEHYFTDGNTTAIIIEKNGIGYALTLVANLRYRGSGEYKRYWQKEANQYSHKVFSGKPTQLRICDENLKAADIFNSK